MVTQRQVSQAFKRARATAKAVGRACARAAAAYGRSNTWNPEETSPCDEAAQAMVLALRALARANEYRLLAAEFASQSREGVGKRLAEAVAARARRDFEKLVEFANNNFTVFAADCPDVAARLGRTDA
jgi:hypothetical protein